MDPRPAKDLRPTVLLVSSRAAAVELPRRLASTGRALAGLYAFKLLDLARAIAEPVLLGRGLRPWDTGHDALVAARLLEEPGAEALRPQGDAPRAPVAAALARTLSELRLAGVVPGRLDALRAAGATAEDADRLRALASLYRRFHEAVEGRFADPATLLVAAREHAGTARWLEDAELLVTDELELAPLERRLLEALARLFPVSRLAHTAPPALASSSFASWAGGHGIAPVSMRETVLAPLEVASVPEGLGRLRTSLFEAPAGMPVPDGSVELLTAPGETAEARSIVRRLLREAARGVPFEEMGVLLARPHDYAPLFTDLLERLGVPHRLHPSLPLRFGRSARSLLLLLRCRGLERSAVLEFLTFAPVPWATILGEGVTPRPAQWDAISRDAGIVSGLDRWQVGLAAYARAEGEAAQEETDPDRRARRERRVADAAALRRIVETLQATLDTLAGKAAWPEWSGRLRIVFDQWMGRGRDREAVADVIADLAGLGSIEGRASWTEVEGVLDARFEWERLPLTPVAGGAVHVGALDAIAGVPFRVVAIPGLVEGGYPGVLRPDPFLLDPERRALGDGPPAPRGQLSLFQDAPAASVGSLDTTQDRLLQARRRFHRALSQATERLVLSYPRADPRTGRERMPSLFFVAAASALEGRPLSGADLDALVVEDDLDVLPLDEALDAAERDRLRVRRGGREAAQAIASASPFFRRSREAHRSRWSRGFSAYDGRVELTARDGLTPERIAEIRRRLDPVTSPWPISASRLADFSRCGFLYLLKHVLGLEPALEPEERRRLDPLERGSLFHEVAERFLRERRDRGELPVRSTPDARARLLEIADTSLEAFVAGSPPRFTFLWERERRRFRESLLSWLEREAKSESRAQPAYFEVGFGLRRPAASGEPDSLDPLTIDLGDGRTLRVSGKIDRIDRQPDGTLILRDYKTGRAPKDDGGTFRGGKQLQIPFYVLAAAKLFPGQPVVEAFLDFVDAGRQVALDPSSVHGEEFKGLLRGLVHEIASGSFAQEPSSCEWCDYTAVCGPRPLLELRRRYKLGDPRIQALLRLRDIG